VTFGHSGERTRREARGVFGIYGPDVDVARSTYFGLYGLQHRGQESAGIATSDGERLRFYKNMGLVSQVFTGHSAPARQTHRDWPQPLLDHRELAGRERGPDVLRVSVIVLPKRGLS